MRIYLLLFFVATISSCSVLDKEEEIPAYIYIEKIDLVTDFQTMGTNSHEILDAWVYVDDNPIGVFELPARIPVLKEGYHEIKIFAGVKADGIASRRRLYPFMQPYVIQSFNFRRGEVDTLNGSLQPVVTYYPTTAIRIWRDAHFDDVGIPFTADPSSDTSMERTVVPSEVFEGLGSGVITLSASQTFFKAISSANLDPPKGGLPVYMELNYKTNNTLRVGLRSISSGNIVDMDNTIIRPSYDDNGNLVWKKIYIELTELVNINLSSVSSEIYFKLIKDDGIAVPVAYIDNIKVLYGL
jgi:hypothetical protein